jgi:hypothetical protein
MAETICLTLGAALAILAALQKWAGLDGPFVQPLLEALFGATAATYVGVWWQSVRSGHISLRSHTLRRRDTPVRFWTASVFLLAAAVAITTAMAMQLFERARAAIAPPAERLEEQPSPRPLNDDDPRP